MHFIPELGGRVAVLGVGVRLHGFSAEVVRLRREADACSVVLKYKLILYRVLHLLTSPMVQDS